MPQDFLLGTLLIALVTLIVVAWLWFIHELMICFLLIAFGKDRFQESMQRLGLTVCERLEPWEKDRYFGAFGQLPYHISPLLAKYSDGPLAASASLMSVASDKVGRVTFGLAPLPRRIQTPASPYVVLASAMLTQPSRSGTAIITIRGTTIRPSPAAEPILATHLQDMLPTLSADIRVIQSAKPWLTRTPTIDLGYSDGRAVAAVRMCPITRAAPSAYSAIYRILAALANQAGVNAHAATNTTDSAT